MEHIRPKNKVLYSSSKPRYLYPKPETNTRGTKNLDKLIMNKPWHNSDLTLKIPVIWNFFIFPFFGFSMSYPIYVRRQRIWSMSQFLVMSYNVVLYPSALSERIEASCLNNDFCVVHSLPLKRSAIPCNALYSKVHLVTYNLSLDSLH